jgi:hypothetical protein
MEFVVKMKTYNMKTNIVILYLFFTIILLGCQKNDPDDQIIGKWRWVKTIIPYGQIETNPQLTGFTKSLVFLPDETIKEFKNDTLINTTNYIIETSYAGQLRLVSSIITSNFSIEKDSLIFNEAYVDGPVIWYVKTKK